MKKLIHVKDKDKRKRKRVELFSELPAKIEALGRSISAKIKDVSYSGIGVILSPGEEFPTIDSLETKIELSNQLFQGRIANRIILPNQEIKIGLVLSSEGNKEIDFSTMDSSWDRVTDPETVENIYHDLAIKGPEAPISIRQNFSTATLTPLKMTDSGSLVCEINKIHQGVLEKGRSKCMFDLFQTCHAFDAAIEKIDNIKVELKLSGTLARLLRRETVRIQKRNAKFEMKIRLVSKDLNTTIEEYEIFDYSEHGISMLDPEGNLSLPRNLIFSEAHIEIKGIGIVLGEAEVRSYQWNRDMDSYIVGLRFQPDHEPHLTNWHNVVLKARYPNLDFDYQESDHKQIWDLFERSGYIGLHEKESFNYAYDLTKKSWKLLSEAGTEISKRIKIVKNNEILGHIQFDKIYPKTWVIHHLAIDPKLSKLIGKEIFGVTSDVVLGENAGYIFTLTDSEKSYNQKNYYDFVESYPYKNHNNIKVLELYVIDPEAKNSLVASSDFVIVDANKYDISFIKNYFEKNEDPIVIDALGYNDDIELEEFGKIFTKLNLERSRKFLIAKKDNKILGFSVLERGTDGVNIFAMFDMFSVFLTSDKNKQQVIDSLILASIAYYKSIGKKSVILLLENKCKEHLVKKNISFVFNITRWITIPVVAKRFHSFSQMLYGHLLIKRENIRKKNEDK
jgi:hypothetical protein